MVSLRQSNVRDLLAPENFLWCTGIEDTFITAPSTRTGRTLDEYELTGHYERWADDLALMRELGVNAARYGIPWHRLNPRPGVWDWTWADRPLERLLELGIAPIVDLVHYGLPPWIENAFLHPDYPRYVADYAHRVAERFRGRIHAYTPLNEPRITAWYCGRIGWWPPYRKSWGGFAAVMVAVCRGIVATVEALRAADPDILAVHVDATDWYETADPALAAERHHRQELVFLALDLITGRIDERHALWSWLLRHGTSVDTLAWFRAHAVPLPLLGINLYPMFTRKVLLRTPGGRARIKMTYATGQLIENLAAAYARRHDAPLFISETASVGSLARRRRWLEDSLAAVSRARAAGLPLVGYTWWPLFALVTWSYREGRHPPNYYLKQMGLWDLDATLTRLRTPLVDLYRQFAAAAPTALAPPPARAADAVSRIKT